ncbi:MAG: hypothetical protein ACD_17C00508G0007 [uncultured bacterium]|nr:MAG: hypothetical protein ACD_17C00508G0007 [uncultured bacterium]
MRNFHIDIAPMALGTLLLGLIWVVNGLNPEMPDRMILSGVYNVLSVIVPIAILILGLSITINLIVRILVKVRR